MEPSATRRSGYFLEVAQGPGAGARVPLEPLPKVIGRAREADIRLRDASVARRHALLEERDGVLVLRSLSATSPLHCCGMRLDQVVLRPGMRVELGDCVLQLVGDAGSGSGPSSESSIPK